jgi:hypothetical protein
VAIDYRRSDVLIGGVDDCCALWLHHLVAEFGDFAVLDQIEPLKVPLRQSSSRSCDVGLSANGRRGD